METANELLRNWRDINRLKGDKEKVPTSRPSVPSHFQDTRPPMPPLDAQMERLKLGGPELPVGPPPPEAYIRPVPPSQPQPDRFPNEVQPYPPRIASPPSQQSQLPPQYPPYNQQAVPSPRPPPGRVPVPSPFPDGRPQLPQPPQYEMGQPPYPPQAGRLQTPPPPVKQVPPPGPIGVSPRPPDNRIQQSPQRIPQQLPPQRQQPRRKVGLDDFNFLAVLGKGNFGKVMLAEEKKSNSLYAIKVLKKEFIIDNDEVESTRSEKRVFLAAARERHPFLLGLHSCFQTETRVYFVMEYVSGGDLMLHIQRKQFSLRQAKFYAAEVLLALEYFHANGIVYRDLKLDNILLTLDGHVKVADYGLCKEDMWFGSTTSTFCGTPEFMAPEILLEQRYGRAVDWWAFGVLTYEMLLGQSPFRGDDEDEIFDAILEDEPLYPITMPRDAVSILQKLLTRDPLRRLGSGKEDAEEIKRQPFFKDTNWDDVVNKRIPPPYFPTINGSADTSNFDEEFTREKPTLTPVHGQLSSRDQAEFDGFSWVAGWADT
jgi:serine/threonine protein kinase